MKDTNRRRWALLVLALMPMLALLGCGEAYPGSGYSSSPVATATPTLGGIAGAYLEAEEAENRLQEAEDLATVQAAQHQATAAVVQATMNAAASDADAAREWAAAQSTATAQAISSHATIVALNIQATAQSAAFEATQTALFRYETATAQAAVAYATATAQTGNAYATATAQAQGLTATAEAQRATATTQAGQLTATAVTYRDNQTATADAHHWQQTVAAGNVTATSVAITATAQARVSERERLTHPLRTYGPWVLMTISVVAIGYIAWRFITVIEIRLRTLKRDARGDAPIYASGDGRAITLYDPDRNFWAGATIIDGQVIKVYETAPSASHQARLVAGDQAVDLVTRGPLDGERQRPFTRRQRMGVARRLLAPPPQPQGGIPGLRGVRVLRSVGQATSAGVIPPALAGSIEKDWIEGEWTEV
jgi:hypothetical protein